MAVQLFRHIGQCLTMAPAMEKEGRHIVESDLGIISKAAMLVFDGMILWIGPEKKLNSRLIKTSLEYFDDLKNTEVNAKLKPGMANKENKNRLAKVQKRNQSNKSRRQQSWQEIDCDQRTMLPGFVECHTHSIFAGDRTAEFEWKMQGVSYQEIAARGGGILNTMQATRQASSRELHMLTAKRVQNFLQQGVTALEIKSGYALNEKDEFKILKVLKKCQQPGRLGKNSTQNSTTGPEIISTFLGAHAKPPEFATTSEYLDFLSGLLVKIKKQNLAERIDIFVESGFFSADIAEKYLQQAQRLGFVTCIHADQISLSGGTDLGLRMSSLSVDHVLQVDASLIKRLAQSAVTAVLLPTADLYMKCRYPNARQMIDAGVRVALATDFNPGTAPSQDLTLVGLLARLQMQMSLPEVISAYTVGASYALNRQVKMGALTSHREANFSLLTADWTSLFYSPGTTAIQQVYRRGLAQINAKRT